MVKPSAMPRGMIVTLCTGSECGSMAATSACPASWYAVFFFSSSESRSDLRSAPISTLSFASSKSYIRTAFRFGRAAANAASFTMLATGLPEADFSAMLGRILPIIVVILPFWLIRVLCKTRDMLKVWPGLLACGLTFAGIQFFWSNFMGAALVDILAGIGTLLVLAFFFRKVWSPKIIWRYTGEEEGQHTNSTA